MSLCTVKFKAAAIGKETAMNVLLPNKGRGPFPVMYLLHGLSDDYSTWLRLTRIEWHVWELPLMVVMPDGDRSFYANSAQCGAYEDHIMKDVIGYVERTFPASRKRRGRAIAGLSMGGYGAMMLGLKYARKFSVICSHSSAFRPDQLLANSPDGRLLYPVMRRKEYDCRALARAVAAKGPRPAVKIDCGTDDYLIEMNRAFHAYLGRIGFPHHYTEYPGVHNWNYWETHIQETIAFVMKHVKV